MLRIQLMTDPIADIEVVRITVESIPYSNAKYTVGAIPLQLLPCDHIQFKQVRRRDQWELSNLITPRPSEII